jgi:hypothetical protein
LLPLDPYRSSLVDFSDANKIVPPTGDTTPKTVWRDIMRSDLRWDAKGLVVKLEFRDRADIDSRPDTASERGGDRRKGKENGSDGGENEVRMLCRVDGWRWVEK